MLIGEISKRTSLSRDTIRFYEKKGLIQVDRTDSEWNNYKNYSVETLNQLLLIKRAKGFGFTLNEISELMELFEMDKASCDTLSVKIKEKLGDIDKKIEELKNMKKMIFDKMLEAQNNCMPISEKGNCQNFLADKTVVNTK
ncbi:MAG: MerR family transcriptional regulator [Flavobacteriales bacterium]|nr:MerR family transcriptional regulator [Flavobacteriales bacterium]